MHFSGEPQIMLTALFARRDDSKFSTGKFGKVEVAKEKGKGTFLYIFVST
jgi:hypothetical protein